VTIENAAVKGGKECYGIIPSL